jgi:hypothetical protein
MANDAPGLASLLVRLSSNDPVNSYETLLDG